jgi:hypothetical protein
MGRLVLNCGEADLVTHELVGDVIMIGRAPLNHIALTIRQYQRNTQYSRESATPIA